MSDQPIFGQDVYPVDVSLTSSELVYGLINHDNQTDYNSLTLRIGPPLPNPDQIHSRNTRILATARPSAPTQGQAYLYYNRISLAYYLQNFAYIEVDLDDTMQTMQDLIPQFKTLFGITFENDDVRPLAIDRTPGAENRFVIASSSLAWMDSVPLYLNLPPVDIGPLQGNPVLEIIHVSSDDVRVYGELYAYVIDATAFAGLLSTFTYPYPMTNAGLASALTLATGDTWVYQAAPAAYNLYSAQVAFNGRVVDQTVYPGKVGYTNVCVITLDETSATDISGPLVLYYNH